MYIVLAYEDRLHTFTLNVAPYIYIQLVVDIFFFLNNEDSYWCFRSHSVHIIELTEDKSKPLI